MKTTSTDYDKTDAMDPQDNVQQKKKTKSYMQKDRQKAKIASVNETALSIFGTNKCQTCTKNKSALAEANEKLARQESEMAELASKITDMKSSLDVK